MLPMSSKIHFDIKLSAILEKIQVKDTGLNLSILGGLVFGFGQTIAFFH
jgi:hypothetical protein